MRKIAKYGKSGIIPTGRWTFIVKHLNFLKSGEKRETVWVPVRPVRDTWRVMNGTTFCTRAPKGSKGVPLGFGGKT